MFTMAVLDEIPGIEVTVQVDGQDTTEFNPPYVSETGSEAESGTECKGSSKRPVVSKYIEAIDDATFSVKVAVSNKTYAWDDIEHSLCACMYVDGVYFTHRLFNKNNSSLAVKTFDGKPCYQYSESSSQCYVKKLKFAAISTVDGCEKTRITKEKKMVERLGLIKVTFRRYVVVGPGTSPTAPVTILDKRLELAKQSLKGKAVSHSTLLQAAESPDHPDWFATKEVPEHGGPIAIFQFLYRSEESLKQEMVIPRTPSPEVPQSINGMSLAEPERLAQERLDQLRWAQEGKSCDNKSAVKREVHQVVDLDDKAHGARPAKRPVVIIDPTDD
ncbi:hypothetical protein F5Y19DRAFT_487377 [Xylariaceae sp. FL1651]|nr:hypothetical protein F5Y19DRAFT_487377 [Xylariaceae sp. FL1651]